MDSVALTLVVFFIGGFAPEFAVTLGLMMGGAPLALICGRQLQGWKKDWAASRAVFNHLSAQRTKFSSAKVP